jgi:hypothetical protein
MFENDAASEGLITVGDLRKRLKGADSRAVVHVCVDGISYAPVTDAKFEGPTQAEKDEGVIGVFLVMPDPSSELVQSLPGDPGVKPRLLGGELIEVPVKFSGTVRVYIPRDVPTAQRRSLAEKYALARILATTENPDAPEDDACDDFANDFELDEDKAGEMWDRVKDDGVGGQWSTNY